MNYKRLTAQSEVFDGATLKAFCESCGEDDCRAFCCDETGTPQCDICPVQEAFDCLAQYEDIGTLDEFADLKNRQEGTWERMGNPWGELEAFGWECGHFGPAASPYCPNCGRKMAGGEDKAVLSIEFVELGGNIMIEPREQVKWFSGEMEKTLLENDHKGG
ncbi:hypothetical protein [Desulfosporosinus shakirovi]|uniref:hypothetical protein n=1 Tax=Desulfosporosinus shakirovi TaxID=2885154 RepID=UPI001E46E1A4|nr:hypothetical protein [Desulfosporosinus sp. SRJS8]MCB8818679.1 hypothetical protein [Desulfosporosinus sp. SRJS8]